MAEFQESTKKAFNAGCSDYGTFISSIYIGQERNSQDMVPHSQMIERVFPQYSVEMMNQGYIVSYKIVTTSNYDSDYGTTYSFFS